MECRIQDFIVFVRVAIEKRYNQIFDILLEQKNGKYTDDNSDCMILKVSFVDKKGSDFAIITLVFESDEYTVTRINSNELLLPKDYFVDVLRSLSEEEPFFEKMAKELDEYESFGYDPEDYNVMEIEDFHDVLDNLFVEEKVKQYMQMLN